MANNNIRFNVGFDTDASNLSKLKSTLSDIQKMTTSDYMSLHKGMDLSTAKSELLEVKRSVNEVQKALKKSFNTDLGTTNVVKFNQELKKMNISNIAAGFNKVGAVGQNAFRDVTSHILTTNLQLKETHKFLDSMATTMGNTIKWGVASGIMNNFTGSVQQAYSYVRDLDKSLTNIRIVSGQSASQMADFAEQANSAAQAMGATTTRYTDAALIYYQQGLSTEEVIDRTNTTMQMANVLGESSDKVASYMTAIWNNFDDGSKSLEYYGDVVTELGAKTAASSEEIAQGLEKFASVAESSGLSYEYATASLATVVAATRQSADIVGTAFKTLFARIQGLNLGETLDDGTTLNKYSSALDAVGISIKDQNGELKDMDIILNEMGSKWGGLNRDQQLALAQTVAGTRQYNQLVALMENWEEVQKNVNVAKEAGGALDAQQETYMESLQAHLNQIQSAKEDLYTAFFDTDSFKDVLDIVTALTKGLGNFVKGIGGGGTALLALGSIATNVFSRQIAGGLATVINNFRATRENAKQLAAQLEIINTYKTFNLGDAGVQQLVDMKKHILDLGALVTTEQQNAANAIIQETAELQNQQNEWDAKLEKAREYTSKIEDIKDIDSFKDIGDGAEFEKVSAALENVSSNRKKASKDLGIYKKQLDATREATLSSNNATENGEELKKQATQAENDLKTALGKVALEMENVGKAEGATAEQQQELTKAVDDYNAAIESDTNASEAGQALLETYERVNNEIRQSAEETLDIVQQESGGASNTIQQNLDGAEKKWETFTKSLDAQKVAQGFTKLLAGIGQVAAGLQSLSNITEIWNNQDLSTGEKFLQIISALSMGLPMVITGAASAVTGIKTLVDFIRTSLIPAFTEMGAAAWASLGPYALAVAAVVAALAVLGAGIYFAVKAFNADAEAAKEAAKQVETLSERYQELKQAAQDFKDTVSNYSEAKKELDDLKIGTEEYKKALEEANEKAKELIETYGLYDKWHMENGLITFDEGALEEMQSSMDAAANVANKNLMAAKIVSNQASLKSETTNIVRKLDPVVKEKYDAGYTERAFTNDELQEAAASMAKLTEANNGVALSDEQLKDKMLEMSGELSPAISENIDYLIKNRSLLEELADSMDIAKKANEYYAEQILGMVIEDDYGKRIEAMSTDEEGTVNEALVSQITAAITKAGVKTASENDANLQTLLEGVNGNKATSNNALNDILAENDRDYSISNDKDLALTYANKVLKYDRKELAYEHGWNHGTVKDGTDKKIVNNVSDNVMRHALAKQAQIDKITENFEAKVDETGSVEKTVKAMEKMQTNVDKFGDSFEADFTNAILNGMASGDFTKLDFTSLFGEIDPDEYAKLMGMDQQTLLTSLGLTPDDIKALGYDDATAFYNAWQEGLNQYDPLDYWNQQFDKANKNISTVTSALDAAQKDKDLDEEQATAVEELKSKYAELFAGLQEGTHEYLEALRQVREQEEDNAKVALEGIRDEKQAKLDQIQSELEELKNKPVTDGAIGNTIRQIQIQAKTEEFEDAMKELEEAEYNVKVQVDADLASDVESAFGLAEEFDDLQDYIASSLQVTADQAQKIIADGYGEMLQNAKSTADGMMQLDADTVNSFIDGKQTELEADKQAKIAELQNQREMLVTQLNILKAKQTALNNARTAETGADKKKYLAEARMLQAQYQAEVEAMSAGLEAEDQANQQMSDGAAKLYNTLSGMYDTDSQNEQNATDAADEISAMHGQNVVDYYNNMQRAVVAYSKAVRDAEKGKAKYKKVPWNSGGGGTGTESTSQATVENAYDTAYEAIESTIDDLTKGLEDSQINEVIDQMSQDTQNQMDTINAQIGAIDAGIASLETSSNTLDKKQVDETKNSSGQEEKEADPKVMEYLDEKADKYHDIDIEIKNIETDLNRLQKAESRLSGAALVENLNKQLSKLQEKTQKYGEKVNSLINDANELKNSLSNQGVAFNDDGTISNYETILKAREQYVNDLITQYNGMSAKEQEGFEDTINQAKKDYEDFKKNLSEYDTLISNTIPSLQDQIEDVLSKEIEIQVKKFNMEFEITLDLTKAAKEWNKFKRKIIKGIKDDDVLGGAKETFANLGAYYNTGNTGQIQIDTKHLKEIQDELAVLDAGGHSDIYSEYNAETDTWVDNRAQAVKDLQKNYEQLMSDMEGYEDMIDSINEAFLKGIDNVADAYEQQSKTFQFFAKQIDHDMNMIKLLYGDKAYDKMSQQYEKQVASDEKQIDNLQERADYWKKMMDAARDAGDEEAYKKYRDNWMSTVETLNSTIEEWAQHITDEYANTINKIFDELEKKLTNGKGLDYISEELDLLNKNADMYLDTINSAYSIQNLKTKWQDAISGTDSINAQKELNALMDEQIKKLESKEKLTQYDVERAEKEYEIALKQIALEEAQQNKSTMRLNRDANGNYSYQFVSDEDSMLQAQQDLAAAQNELYNFDKEAYQQNLDEAYSTWSEFQQKITDAYIEFADDQDALSARIALLQEQYGEQTNSLTEQNLNIRGNLQDSAFTNLAAMYETDVSNFQSMSNEEKDIIMNDLVPQWSSGVQEMTDKFAGEGGFAPTCEDAFRELGEAADEYKEKQEEVGRVSEKVGQQVEEEQGILEREAERAINAAEEERQRIEEVRKEVQGLIADYKEARNAAVQAANAAYAYWTQEQKKSIAAVNNDLNNPGGGFGSGNGSGGGSGNGGSGNGGSGGSGGDGKLSVGDTATFTGKYYYDSYGYSPIGSKYSGMANGVVIDIVNNNPYGAHIHSADGKYSDLGWVKKSQLSGYDTGGYTGEWDSSGRLALLHQKELVLNAHDTENILNIVGMVRDFADSFNSSLLDRLFNLNNSVLSTIDGVGNESELEQNVHIEATFPGVKDAKEIEDALNNLVNTASQYANRKQR